MSELLAPAGDERSAYAAINCGADAVYLGLTAFSARSSAQNFDFPALEKLIAYAHFFGARVYVAMNTLVKEEEVPAFIENAVRAHNAGADAIIIQDIYLGARLKEMCPQLCLHLSTQAGTCNEYGARLAKELGYSRVILARETAFADIEKIAKIIETEVFVQGALCTAFSGQCYFSSFAGGNSGNRGRCKQPCRKLCSIDRKGFEGMAYRLSPSDLCAGENILKYRDAGVYSFKIEGRMRRPEYVAAAVKYYKNILGGTPQEGDLSALKRTYNRGNYTKGLAFGQDRSFLSSAVQGHIGEYLGTVSVVGGKYVVGTRERCGEGDCFKVLRDGREIAGATYLSPCKGGFCVRSSERLKNGDKVFITTDASLNAELIGQSRTRKVPLKISVRKGEKLIAELGGRKYVSDFCGQEALSRPTTEEDIKRAFDKVDTYPFATEYVVVNVEEGVFVPASLLNAFRRQIYSDYYLSVADKRQKCSLPALPERAQPPRAQNKMTAVIAENLCGLVADIGILKPRDYFADLSPLVGGFVGEKFLFLPPFLTGEEIERLKPAISAFDGIYCGSHYAAELARELNVKYFAGTGANLSNSLALQKIAADYVALSKELTSREAKPLAAENTFVLTAGEIKLMDLIYCPFGKSCSSCDRRARYALTDEGKRQFVLRRYETASCRFEIYNCAKLISENNYTGRLYDFSATCDAPAVLRAAEGGADGLRAVFANYTRGHSETPVL